MDYAHHTDFGRKIPPTPINTRNSLKINMLYICDVRFLFITLQQLTINEDTTGNRPQRYANKGQKVHFSGCKESIY